MKKIKLLLLSVAFVLLGACKGEIASFDSSPSSVESVAYEKDELGFYKLPKEDLYAPLGEESRIQYAKSIDNVSSSLRLFEQGNNIPLYPVMVNTSNSWTPNNYTRVENSVAIIEKSGPVTLVLQTNFGLKQGAIIRPLSSNIDFSVDQEKRLITFTILQSGQYTIEFRSNRTLHLFITEIGAFDSYKNASNVIYFGPGVHNKDNDKRIDRNNNLSIQSNQTVFLDLGAVLQGSLTAYNASNIVVAGPGIIDGATFERDADKGTRQIPLDFNYCKNVTFKGISCLDPAGWTYNMYFVEDLIINDIKIISSRSNGDGISLQSCKNVHVSDSFVRSWDDSLVVKNYPHWSDKNRHGETRDIFFDNCLLWTDLAQSMEIGFETIGEVMDNINFTNITVLHNFHKPAISIHNGNNANVTNVTFKNIIIEDASMGRGDGKDTLIEISTEFSPTWSTNHTTTALGSVNGVLLENIKVLKGKANLKISLLGTMDTRPGFNNSIHMVENVTFKDVFIYSSKINSDYEWLTMNEYVRNINFN